VTDTAPPTQEPQQQAQQAQIDAILAGDIRTGARLMRDLDDRRPAALEALKALFPHTGKAYLVGVTGNPGAGKSTVVDALIAHYRAVAERVGVVCVDPTSPFSGGAILGDRIRMQRHALDAGVFIRSLATRGHLGGLSRSTFDVAHVLDAMGYGRVLIETVGVGQDEVDVMKAAHTTVVVTVPGLGDDIQAIKSGLLEVADVLVVNKADREGADRAERDLLHMLDLRAHGERKDVEIVRTIATRGTAEGSGITELAAAIERHRERVWSGEGAAARGAARAAVHLQELVRALLTDRAAHAIDERGGLAELVRAIVERRADPWTVAEQLVGGAAHAGLRV
jgi:LAO/AO transport system kinase